MLLSELHDNNKIETKVLFGIISVYKMRIIKSMTSNNLDFRKNVFCFEDLLKRIFKSFKNLRF